MGNAELLGEHGQHVTCAILLILACGTCTGVCSILVLKQYLLK